MAIKQNKMAFKNPWGKGSDQHDKWFKNRWGDDSGEKSKWFNRDEEGSSLQTDNQSVISETKTALICYGNGAELGDFSIFADYLKKKHLMLKYKEENIFVVKTISRIGFMHAVLAKGGENLTELHVFSHSAGAGLYLGYHLDVMNKRRVELLSNYPDPTYDQVIHSEIGGLLTDHLIETYSKKKVAVQKALVNLEFTKFWGCNTGVKDWVYDNSSPYWGALNEKNTPKPSMAQAFADFSKKTVYGANSGSHIEFLVNGAWGTYDKMPSGYTDMRLHPDVGDYVAFTPQ